jgi:hypothetical protein
MGREQPLAQGQGGQAALDLAKAGKVDLEYVVESMGAQAPSGAKPAAMDHGTMGHGTMDHAH